MQQDFKRIPINLHNQVIACLRKYLAQANQLLNMQFTEPKIIYKPKGSVAGSAFLMRWEIQLNSTMLADNGQVFIEEVVPHELAHLIVFKKFGNVKPHGKEWQYVMSNILGKMPKTTHNFDVKRDFFLYYCEYQEHQLTKIRHNKVQHNNINYLCRKCGTQLKQKMLS
ncbi:MULTISPECIES: SprT family zinc-dependent metalloprotease [unclassified Gilliamella]|uniref:SprT family zinc-dependent metalloprotease n=1 Tax=unclassified Gilliamella TaxID=2685620 RepID=UPI00226AAB90|nr:MULTISPECIES: SprT family zinc-dependent metalloprotease [unclassified Gilliamella]MCX8575030.1 SprT family zinc-dependent metalloprotease [Gilliamella sp. B3831]MCX8577412.1 SprT family zinc-dependent metalloprotease [Gilliamella sp. B3815]MCX8590128.1 SprT family zinc-dependent metalloprotease [Gilliamella sp. B3812]MCX8604362.1 SprT family zinc-dependent metalloprotease [Gilliamella sp. B3823]MCX8606356.1 SprT family zinc-dependent metalloprotease [Gilliamella sp. B3825]